MEHQSGCLVCGAELLYRQSAENMACLLCGKEFESTAACANGHFICDACHGLGALDWIESRCRTSDSRDPIALAVELMAHPGVKMHGPEHHFLFPAAMAAAYANTIGRPEEKSGWLNLIRQRSQIVPGGFCGFQGACGAGIGMGIFMSVVTGSSTLGGPRC